MKPGAMLSERQGMVILFGMVLLVAAASAGAGILIGWSIWG